jgi:Cdc6-like AAA superfamily ATPase
VYEAEPLKEEAPTERSKKKKDKKIFNYETQAIAAPGRSDEPSSTDYLERSNFVYALAALISHERTEVPLTIGIYGEWGSGKSSMMKQLEELLKRKHHIVNFNAWRYSTVEELWAALVGKAANALDRQLSILMRLRFFLFSGYASGLRHKLLQLGHRFLAGIKKIENWLVSFILSIGLLNLTYGKSILHLNSIELPKMLKLAFLVLSVLVFIYKLGRIALRPFSTQFEVYQVNLKNRRDERKQMTQADLNIISSLFKKYKQSRKRKKIVVFMDDLDRCPPDKITDILEAVNLFFEGLPFVTVFGLSPKVVSRAVANEYKFLLDKDADGDEKEQFGRSFLQKIIHIPFQIPPVETLNPYVESLMVQINKDKEMSLVSIIKDYGKEYLNQNQFSGFKKFKAYFSVLYINISTWLFFHNKSRTPDEQMNFLCSICLLYRLDLTSSQKEWLDRQVLPDQIFFNKAQEKYDIENINLSFFTKSWRLMRTAKEAQDEVLRNEIEMEIKDAEVLKRFSLSLRGNPRAIKRFINVYQLAKGINAQLPVGKQAPREELTAWLVLLQNWPTEGAKFHYEISSNRNNGSVLFESIIQEESLPKPFREYIEEHKDQLITLANHKEGFNIARCFSFYTYY